MVKNELYILPYPRTMKFQNVTSFTPEMAPDALVNCVAPGCVLAPLYDLISKI